MAQKFKSIIMNPTHYGDSIGICVSDVLQYWDEQDKDPVDEEEMGDYEGWKDFVESSDPIHTQPSSKDINVLKFKKDCEQYRVSSSVLSIYAEDDCLDQLRVHGLALKIYDNVVHMADASKDIHQAMISGNDFGVMSNSLEYSTPPLCEDSSYDTRESETFYIQGNAHTSCRKTSSWTLKKRHVLIREEISTLYETKAVPSGFGNVKEQETQHNPDVRSSKELGAPDITVHDKMLRRIEWIWGLTFEPFDVRAEFYKMNLYKKGDHFNSHLDTPEKNLLGTFVLSVASFKDKAREFPTDETKQTKEEKEKDREEHVDQPEDEDETYPGIRVGTTNVPLHRGSWVMFFTDTPHEVPVVQEEYRVTLTFKIFARETSVISTPGVGTAVIQACIDQMPRNFGYLFKHKYSSGHTLFKGTDALLFQQLNQLALAHPDKYEVTTCPVTTHFHANEPSENDDVAEDPTSLVYSLSTPSIQDALKPRQLKKKKEKTKKKKLKVSSSESDDESKDKCTIFISLDDTPDRKAYYHHHEPSCEYTGNESRSGDINSIYVRQALIFRFKPDFIRTPMGPPPSSTKKDKTDGEESEDESEPYSTDRAKSKLLEKKKKVLSSDDDNSVMEKEEVESESEDE